MENCRMRVLAAVLLVGTILCATAFGQSFPIRPPFPDSAMQHPAAYLVMTPAASGDDTAQITTAFANSAARPVMLGKGIYNVNCGAGEIPIPDKGVVVGPGSFGPDESQTDNPLFANMSRLVCKSGTHPAAGFGVVRVNNNVTLTGFQISADTTGNRQGDCVDAVSTTSGRAYRLLFDHCDAGINNS